MVLPQQNTPSMAFPEILQEFDRLDKDSSQFPDQRTSLLYKKRLKDHIPKSRDEDVVWLAEYLDRVSLCRTICSVGSALLPTDSIASEKSENIQMAVRI